MIPHITLVVILFLSNTLAKPTPQHEKVADDYSLMMGQSQVPEETFVRTVGSSEGSGEHSEEPEEGSAFFKNSALYVPTFREQEGSGEGSGGNSQEEVSDLERSVPYRDLEGSGEGSGEFMILEAEMGSDVGIDGQVIAKLAEEEEMTTESEMMVNNLVPRFDLEMGSGDGEELLKISSEEEASGDDIFIKIMTEEVAEGSGAEFRFAEISDEIGSGDDSTEAPFEADVRQVEIDEEIGDITTEVSLRKIVGDPAEYIAVYEE